MNVSAAALQERAAAGRPGSASQISPRTSTRRGSSGSSAAPLRGSYSTSEASTRSQGARASERVRLGPGDDQRLDRQPVALGVARQHRDRVRRPVGRQHAPAGRRGRERRQAEAAAQLEHARAAQRAHADGPRQSGRARPQLGPVGQELLVLERLLGRAAIRRRGDAAGTGRARRSPPPLRRDRPPVPGCLNQRTAPRHQRRRRAPRRRLAVHGLARALRQSGRAHLRAHGGGGQAPRRRSSATARTSRRGRCGPASRAASRSSSPTSPTRSSAACCEAPSAPRRARATPSCWSTSATTARGRRRACRRCSPAPPTACCCSRSSSRPAPTEHAIQIEMRPGKLPVVRLDVEAGVDCALDHLLGLGHTRIAHVASNFDAPTFDLRRDRMRARLGDVPPTALAPFTFDGAAEAAGPLLDAGGFTAVFCDDDILAGGVYLAARDRGIRIPEDLSRRRLRRPRLRARARAAADDGRGRRRGPRRGGLRGAGAGPRRRARRAPSRSCRSG